MSFAASFVGTLVPEAKSHFACTVQVQTIKTSVESAIMLLRIDDIVSGISKKSRGGGGQPSGTQTEDHDNVSIFAAVHFVLSAVVCLYHHDGRSILSATYYI